MSNAVKVQLIIIGTPSGWTMESQRPADVTPDRLDVVMLAFDVVDDPLVAGRCNRQRLDEVKTHPAVRPCATHNCWTFTVILCDT